MDVCCSLSSSREFEFLPLGFRSIAEGSCGWDAGAFTRRPDGDKKPTRACSLAIAPPQPLQTHSWSVKSIGNTVLSMNRFGRSLELSHAVREWNDLV